MNIADDPTVGLWLLPELSAAHVVQAGPEVSTNTDLSEDAGFKRRPDDQSQKTDKKILPRALTADRLEQLEEEAKIEGYEAGRAEGYRAGYSEGEARAKSVSDERAATLSVLIDSAVTEVDAHLESIESTLIALIAKISRQLCLRELSVDQQTIAGVVERAISALPLSEKQVSIRLNPLDYEFLNRINGFVKPQWQLSADQSIQLGGCRLHTENSLVDFTISKRLEVILVEAFGVEISLEDIPANIDNELSNDND